MSTILPLIITFEDNAPIEGFKSIGTLNNTPLYHGHTLEKIYTVTYSNKTFQINLEGYNHILFEKEGRFKLYSRSDNPSILQAVEMKVKERLIANRDGRKAYSSEIHKTIYISSDELRKRAKSDSPIFQRKQHDKDS